MTGHHILVASRAYGAQLDRLQRRLEELMAQVSACATAEEKLGATVTQAVDELREVETPSRDVAADALENVSYPDAEELERGLRELLEEVRRERAKLRGVDDAAALVGRAR